MNYVRLNKDQIKQHGPYLEALQNCTDKDSLSLRHIIHDKEIECLIATTGKIACIYKIPQELQAVFYGLDFLSYSKGTVMEEAPTGAVIPDYNQILVRFEKQKDWKNLVVITANHRAKWAGLLVSGWELGGLFTNTDDLDRVASCAERFARIACLDNQVLLKSDDDSFLCDVMAMQTPELYEGRRASQNET